MYMCKLCYRLKREREREKEGKVFLLEGACPGMAPVPFSLLKKEPDSEKIYEPNELYRLIFPNPKISAEMRESGFPFVSLSGIVSFLSTPTC
jgi:hypothetical protein